ncbi:hypothetical protein VN97_g4752 [Penicillium thymicola]|uniref:Uncharacterized protein n=1 Tax=Penicillium thymicola TaxID=293382 RepID=A0AAI9TJZ7_PENTH|nr:hypothetical protein VN97_g4752 [Penicillium thymicola]
MSIPKARAWHWVGSGPIFLGGGQSIIAVIRSDSLFDIFLDKVRTQVVPRVHYYCTGMGNSTWESTAGCLRIDIGTSCYNTSTGVYW